MSRILRAALSMLAVASLVAPVAEAGGPHDRGGDRDDHPKFSVRDVQGPTAFAFDGFVGPEAAAAVGRFVADGRGNLHDGVRTLVVGGVTLEQTFTCTYNVDRNGTGDATCTLVTVSPPGVSDATETFDFVIVERKKKAFFTSTTPGSTIRGLTNRQH